jgi:hypothetical protein
MIGLLLRFKYFLKIRRKDKKAKDNCPVDAFAV